MSNLEEQIEKEKQRYLDYADRNSDKRIYIYGENRRFRLPIFIKRTTFR